MPASTRPRCPSVSPEGYRCRRRAHGPQVPHVAYGWIGAQEWTEEEAAPSRWQVVTIGAGEYGWSVDRLEQAAAGHEPTPIRVAEWVEPGSVNRSWLRSVDLNTPVILVPHPATGRPILVDGRHRVFKAWKQGRADVPAVILTEAEEQAARFTPEEWDRFHEPDPFAQEQA